MATGGHLALPNLSIQGFRGIDELSIRRLGRVTLLAGKNSVGKTTVLEAVRVYASRARHAVLYELLEGREEVSAGVDEDGDRVLQPNWRALFHGRDGYQPGRISIGSDTTRLQIDKTPLSEKQFSLFERLNPRSLADARMQALRVKFQGTEWSLPCIIASDESGANFNLRSTAWRTKRGIQHLFDENERVPEIDCDSLGPGLLSNDAIARFWDRVALTDDENRAVEALRIALGADVDRVAVIGDDTPVHWRAGRRVVVKLRSHERPVPLRSLGDGALRMFGVALALANSRDGFLLLDEAENGIHHSVQRDFWRMVLGTAHENNVQVLATTHSWDCIRGFAQAAKEAGESGGVLVRLDRDDAVLRAVEYSGEDLEAAAEQDIEVR